MLTIEEKQIISTKMEEVQARIGKLEAELEKANGGLEGYQADLTQAKQSRDMAKAATAATRLAGAQSVVDTIGGELGQARSELAGLERQLAHDDVIAHLVGRAQAVRDAKNRYNAIYKKLSDAIYEAAGQVQAAQREWDQNRAWFHGVARDYAPKAAPAFPPKWGDDHTRAAYSEFAAEMRGHGVEIGDLFLEAGIAVPEYGPSEFIKLFWERFERNR